MCWLQGYVDDRYDDMVATGVGCVQSKFCDDDRGKLRITRVGCRPLGCSGSHRDRLRNTMCCDGYSGRLKVTFRAIKCRY